VAILREDQRFESVPLRDQKARPPSYGGVALQNADTGIAGSMRRWGVMEGGSLSAPTAICYRHA
jgi:hypothetical protein